MYSLEALRQQLEQAERELENATEVLEEAQESVDSAKYTRDKLQEAIDGYEKYAEQERIREREKDVLMWLTGQDKRNYDVGVYNGVVSRVCDVCVFKNDKPHGTESEIFDILKKYGCMTLEIRTRFHECGSWGSFYIHLTFT